MGIDANYAIRVANISRTALNSSTVFDDGAADLLTGDAGQNWFFTGTGDRITDKVVGKKGR